MARSEIRMVWRWAHRKRGRSRSVLRSTRGTRSDGSACLHERQVLTEPRRLQHRHKRLPGCGVRLALLVQTPVPCVQDLKGLRERRLCDAVFINSSTASGPPTNTVGRKNMPARNTGPSVSARFATNASGSLR
eukprot:scaffold74384_cov61-Phaeocystis_antarctica.AAC.1